MSKNEMIEFGVNENPEGEVADGNFLSKFLEKTRKIKTRVVNLLRNTDISDRQREESQFFLDLVELSGRFFYLTTKKISRTLILASIFYNPVVSGQEMSRDNPQRVAYKSFEDFQRYINENNDPYISEKEKKEIEKLIKSIDTLKKTLDRYKNENTEKSLEEYKFLLGVCEDLDNSLKDLSKKTIEKMVEDAKTVTFDDFKKDIENVFTDKWKIIDDIRSIIIKRLGSDQYREMAIKEGLSLEEIERRIEVVSSDNIRFEDYFHPVDNPRKLGFYLAGDAERKFGSHPGKVILSIRTENPQLKGVVVHELTHSFVDDNGQLKLSKLAMDIYSDATMPYNYFVVGNKRFDISPEHLKYLSEPNELNARRVAFQFEIEKMGIWKYGETFTEEHYKKIMDFSNQEKFSDSTVEFITIVKKEKLFQMMNLLASNIKTGDGVLDV